MPGELRFLVNPSAGGGRARRVLGPVRMRGSTCGAPVEVSSDGPDLTSRARRALEEGVRRLVVVGGDGTAHLAIQALAETACELAVIPTGRGDDFASSLGVPADPQAAIDLAVTGEAKPVDLVRIDLPDGPVWGGIYASFGFDSAVTRTGNAQPRWIPRQLTYILAALRTLIGFQAPHMTVEHEGGRYERRAMLVTACNAPRYGGGMLIAPEARMDDGLLDVVAVERIPKLRLLRLFPRVFDGRHVGHPAVSTFRSSSARVTADPPVLVGCDGEIVGEIGSEPAGISVAPRSLWAVTPD